VSTPKGITHATRVPPSVPVEEIELGPSLIVIDRCENAEPNCFYTGTWSRAPSMEAVADGRSVLRFGHRGPAVEDLQRFLNDHHPEGEPLEIDGYLGPKTEARLRSFQQKQQIAVDGVVGTETLDAMADLVMRGLVVDERFSGLPDDVQRSALNRLEGTKSSEDRRRMAEILMSEGFAALPHERQQMIAAAEDAGAMRTAWDCHVMMADARTVLE
jgi:hypothetical protein